MQYKLKGNFRTGYDGLEDILLDRGVENYEEFISPDKYNEIDFKLLDNINKGVDILLKHINNNDKILFIVD